MSDVRYCIHCQEILYEGPVPPRCSRCLKRYDPQDPTTFRNKPMFLWWKFWLPGLLLAVASGIGAYHVLLPAEGSGRSMGMALFVALPVSVGAVVGYASRLGGRSVAMLCVLAIASVAVELVIMGASGFFCGLLGPVVILVPALLGCFAGIALGRLASIALKLSRWDQRHFLPLVAILALPYCVHGIERLFPRPLDIATVRTEAVLPGDPATAWRSILFYEEVRHAPPFLLKLALPRPVRSEGKKTEAGGIVRCVYERGHLVKRITEVRAERLLAFRVLEQKLHFERDVTLLDGSFELFPADGLATRVVLTTRYVRHLYPEWLWGPIERKVVHTLNGHVLEGMRFEARAALIAAGRLLQGGSI